MEETTYRDPRVIDFLNDNYIVCKEDHDERQDLTSLYSAYGWPATIIFDSDGNELLKEAGYIDVDRFMTLISKLKQNPIPLPTYKPDADFTFTTNDSIKNAGLHSIHEKFMDALDISGGGFGFGQKFIDFESFEYAFTHSATDTTLHAWLRNTITNSISLYDNSWGGIYQYSTQNDWKHPHFEKLLSIQARYIKMYCWYYMQYKDTEALKRAEGTAAYVNRFLSDPNGGFYTAQDADLIPGQKANEYFALNDADRISKGIPAIDKNIYTSDNAEMAEAFLILWATNGNALYLQKALKCINLLKATHKKYNSYMHGENYTATTSLKDNLAMLKTLLLAYRATQNISYRTEASMLAREISTTFNSGKGYFNTYIGNSPIKASYNISENIEACRLLNYCSYVLNEPAYKKAATDVFNFLTNESIVEAIIVEPGILSASEELKNEPMCAALIVKNGNALKSDFISTCISFPRFYFDSHIYIEKNIPADKLSLFDAFDKNFIILCTSSYCSSPLFSKEAFKDFIYTRAFAPPATRAQYETIAQ